MTSQSTVKTIELQAIRESGADFEPLEKLIRAAFVRLLYNPVIRELNLSRVTLKNASSGLLFDALLRAIAEGRISFRQGSFTGKFDAQTSKDLKALGAAWDRKGERYRIRVKDLPYEIQAAISASAVKFEERLKRIDRLMTQNLPANIADSIDATELFDQRLWKTDRHVRQTLKKITVTPELAPEAREKIATEWQTNLKLWIKDFSAEEIVRLRTDIQKAVTSGKRYDALVTAIKKSYDVTDNKAKFLARQETSLLMTKFKETRYTEAGVTKYRWGCVAGSPSHPVRPSHKLLEGKIFSWNDPPITTPPGESQRRNNPGQDYNCRCFAKPIVQFREKPG